MCETHVLWCTVATMQIKHKRIYIGNSLHASHTIQETSRVNRVTMGGGGGGGLKMGTNKQTNNELSCKKLFSNVLH